MYEHRSEPILPHRSFVLRMVRHALVAFSILAGSLLLGVLGYHFVCQLAWEDALVNASMLLGGMGPVDKVATIPGKLFVSFYALYCGIIFLVFAGVLLGPLLHRFLHRFHLEMDPEEDQDEVAG